MTKGRLVFKVVIAAGLALASCNFPARESNQQTQTNDLIVTVRAATEIRAGPGQVYDLVTVLNPSQQVEAVGLSPSGDYLLIRDPSTQEVLGWLTKDSITASGYPVGLPISTPPPTPTAVTVPAGPGTCLTPIGGGPTPVGCVTPVAASSSDAGCPTPIGGGPTPVGCVTPVGASSPGCPTPIGGGPTPVSCSVPAGPLIPIRRATAVPTIVLRPVRGPTAVPTLVR